MKRWPISKAHIWEEAPFLRLLLPLVCSIICYDTGFIKLNAVPAAVIAVTALLLFCVFTFVKTIRRYDKSFSFLLAMIVLFFTGSSLCALNDVTTKQDWFGHKSKTAAAFTARIEDLPQEKEKTWKLNVELLHSLDGKTQTPVSGKALLYVYKDSLPFALHQGDVILFTNQLQRIKNPGNPFEFDYAGYAAHNNIYYQQFSPAAEISLLQKAPVRQSLLVRCHNWCMQQLQYYLPDKPTQSLLQAMLAGDETGMDHELRDAYAQTGIIHIVSISGSHVAVLFSIVSGLLWWLRNKKYAVLKYLIALLPVWFYVLMAGSPPSAIRAAVMFTILAGGMLLQRDGQPLNTLLAAAFFLLCANPMWLFSVGFQLSFAAVLSLIIFYKPVYRLFHSKYWLLNKLWQGTSASIAAEILVAPLVIYYFHSFPLMFIVANLLAALCMGALLVAGMILLACAQFPVVAHVIAGCCIWLVQWFNKIIYALQSFSPKAFNYLQLSAIETCLVYFAIAGIGIWLMKRNKKALFAGLTIGCSLLTLLCFDDWKAAHQQQLIVYNTGKNNYVEMINGKYFSVLCKNDSARTNMYAPDALHTQLHAWRKQTTTVSAIDYNGKKILLLKDALQPGDSAQFPADVLIITAKLKQLSFSDVARCFQPKQIVLPSGQSRWYAARWKDSCAAHHIALHNTATDGAFVMNCSSFDCAQDDNK